MVYCFINYLGEFYNVQMEELVNWINASTPVDASFAGKKRDS
jgi:hypothetical protein